MQGSDSRRPGLLDGKRSGAGCLLFRSIDVEALPIGHTLSFQLLNQLLDFARDDHRFSRPQRRPVILRRREHGP
jgi:hypothetical protein